MQGRLDPARPGAEDGGAYDETFGRKVVLPSQGTAVNPAPYKSAETLLKAQQAALLTLTTCHPQFSAQQRLIITSVLTQQVPKNQVKDYGDLLSKSGRPDVRLDLAEVPGPVRGEADAGRDPALGVVALLMFVVFPWLEPRLWFNEVAVN